MLKSFADFETNTNIVTGKLYISSAWSSIFPNQRNL
ncbi:hypothetical protein OROMI_016005 [Orobanche minor]